MTNGMFEEPATNAEMELAVILLHIAHTHPDIVDKQRIIRCSQIRFPHNTALRRHFREEDFVRIVQKLIKTRVRSVALMPVILVDGLDPGIRFTEMPQCYFRVVHRNGKFIRQITPKNALMASLRRHSPR